MSSLPPYSTYRTDNKQMMYPQAISHGNVLTFTPPGFTQTLNVKFPDCRLAVCEKCKKNYKTRDMCRVRNAHTAEPWSTAFICITLDDTCTDSDGKYVDKELTVRMVQWQPFCIKTPFDPKTPVCSACKKTNRTRSFCRERHKHRHLPWCTVYVLLSALDSTDPSTVVAAPSKPVAGEQQEEGTTAQDETETDKAEEKSDAAGDENSAPEVKEDTPKETTEPEKAAPVRSASSVSFQDGEDGNTGDDIHDIAESRTFLVKVSCRALSIHWLELAELDATDASAVHGMVAADAQHMHAMNNTGTMPGNSTGQAMQQIDPNQAQYYAQSMGYAQQQHQHALKSHQQYFFQMQQRQQQQYAQAAWKAQYNQGASMPPGSAPPQLPVAGAPGAIPHPAPPGQMVAGAPAAPGQPAPSPVTAGEAAAQQQKQTQDGNGAPPDAGQQPTEPQAGQDPAAQAQWQAQMMYNQQLYQQQLQMQQQQQQAQYQQHGAAPAPGTAPSEQGSSAPQPNQEQYALQPPAMMPMANGMAMPSVGADGGNFDSGEESDPKRPRLSADV